MFLALISPSVVSRMLQFAYIIQSLVGSTPLTTREANTREFKWHYLQRSAQHKCMKCTVFLDIDRVSVVQVTTE